MRAERAERSVREALVDFGERSGRFLPVSEGSAGRVESLRGVNRPCPSCGLPRWSFPEGTFRGHVGVCASALALHASACSSPEGRELVSRLRAARAAAMPVESYRTRSGGEGWPRPYQAEGRGARSQEALERRLVKPVVSRRGG